MGGPGYVNITDMEKKSIKEMLTVNMLAVTLLCHSLLPEMTGRGRGAIINISSVAGLIPLPYVASSLRTLGYNNRTCGYWSHSLGMTLLQNMIPSILCSLIVGLCSRAQLRFAQNQKTTPTAAAPPPV